MWNNLGIKEKANNPVEIFKRMEEFDSLNHRSINLMSTPGKVYKKIITQVSISQTVLS